MRGNGKFQETANVLRGHKQELNARFHVRRIGVFGSAAKGTLRPGSDVDVFVEFERPIGLGFIALCDFLERLLGRRVDVLTQGGLDTIRVKSVARDIKKSLVYV
jgi:predicted nucleotidyltransferase